MAQHKTRTETDSLGSIDVPEHALYGAQTQRAVNNFPISGQEMPSEFIRAVVLIKRCAASVNTSEGALDADVAGSIVEVCDALLAEPLPEQFPVDIYQTGSGTSTNMNVNEVIASLASRALGKPVSANDHVNCSQSSNDVIPSAIHIAATIALQEQLLPAISHLISVIERRAEDCRDYVKTGRTHLMDAMPITLGQELYGWADQLRKCHQRLARLQPQLSELAQGGTAVGTGVNASASFAAAFVRELSALTGLSFAAPERKFDLMASQDTALALSGELKTLAASLTKVCNDLRWMNSGPLSGLGEIRLPALQPGSSIMPGKVNPVIPEAVLMVAATVIGNDTSMTVAGQSGNFQLNVMLPLIACKLLESLRLLANASRVLADSAIAGFEVQTESLTESLARNPVLVTALNPVIGYMAAADIAKQAYAENRPIIDVALEKTDLSRQELETLLDPLSLTGNLTET
ncbi:MAG TPA: aspartate ammonia-lyase [Spongiibacteraceae bacterium]|nr:aspartate ammonia-lyase [Spongiibacteraceae bacterium]HCS26366.1 aspartate ammonia-lyase [Spongiibacteraceae bacterium]